MNPEMLQQFPFLMNLGSGAQPQAQGQPTAPQTGEMDLGGGASAAPQAVSVPAGAMGGSGMSGTTNNPNLQQRWQNYMTHPATTAMLLAMGIEMMKPRWEPMSALPDALSSGVRAQGAFYEDEQKRADAERDFNRETAAQDEKEERATERTRIAASSREDVARANNEARWARDRAKEDFKAGPNGPKEQVIWDRYFRTALQNLKNQNKDARDPIFQRLNPNVKELSPKEMEAMAREEADRNFSGYKVRFGGGQSGGHMQQETQQGTSGNSSTLPPAGGNKAAPHAGGNAANNAATPEATMVKKPGQYSISDLYRDPKIGKAYIDGVLARNDPDEKARLQQLLKPEEWGKLQTYRVEE